MNKKIFLSLISGGLAYIIVVLVNLFLNNPLSVVLKRGLVALILFAMVGGFSLSLLDFFVEKKKKKKRKKSNENIGNEKNEKGPGSEDKSHDFTPLSPPHLEIKEDED